MKITSADVFIGGPGKNYVTLKIMTGQGVYGQGVAKTFGGSNDCRLDQSIRWP